MAHSDYPTPKDISLHWRHFIFVVVFIFLVGIIIGLIITPHPDFQNGSGPPSDPRPDRQLGWIRQALPAYPEESRRLGIGGEVEVEAQTDSSGRVQSVKIIRSVPVLDHAVVEAVKQWIHEPVTIEGAAHGARFRVITAFHPEEHDPACRVDYLGPSAPIKRAP